MPKEIRPVKEMMNPIYIHQSDGMQTATDLFLQVIGKNARNVKLGHGSFITMDFGKDVIVEVKTNRGVSQAVHGEWHLWIMMCAWRLDQNGAPIIGAADSRESIKNHLAILENKLLLEVAITNISFDMLMKFEDNLQLSLFSFGVEDYEQWLFFIPEKKVFEAGPGTTWYYGSSSK